MMSPSKKLRVAIYVRVSTDGQVDGTSLDDQERRCRAYADAHDWTVADVYREEGVSGTKASRPQLDQLMRSAGDGDFDVVLVLKLSRWARKLSLFSSLIDDLDKVKVEFASVAESIDGTTATGRLLRSILGAFAEFERDEILDRTRSGHAAVAAEGFWAGGPAPFGYRLKKEGARTKLVVDEHEAAVVRAVHDCMVDRGMNGSQTAAFLNENSLLPRRSKRWTKTGIRNTIRRTGVWSGDISQKRARDGSAVQVNVPPILTSAEAAALAAAVRQTSTGTPASGAGRYLLRKRLTSPCGLPMRGHQPNKDRPRTYVCAGRDADAEVRCECRRVAADQIETDTWSEVAALLRDPARLIAQARAIHQQLAESAPAEMRDVASLNRRIAAAERGLGTTITELVAAGTDTKAIRFATAQLEDELASLRNSKSRLAAWQAHADNSELNLKRLRELGDHISSMLDDPDPALQRSIIDLLDVRVTMTGYATCPTCEGRGKLRTAPGQAPVRSGSICPTCHHRKWLPELTVSGNAPEVVPSLGGAGPFV